MLGNNTAGMSLDLVLPETVKPPAGIFCKRRMPQIFIFLKMNSGMWRMMSMM